MRTALLAASLVLVAGTAVGCGGGAPTDASTDDFCKTFEEMQQETADLGEDAESTDIVKALKDLGKKMEDVGTPDDISEDARKGFETFVDAIKGLPDDATEKQLDEVDKDFSDAEEKQFEAFQEYVGKTCTGPAEEE